MEYVIQLQFLLCNFNTNVLQSSINFHHLEKTVKKKKQSCNYVVVTFLGHTVIR